MPRADRDVLWLYLLTRISVGLTAHAARWLFPADGGSRTAAAVLAPFQQWDANHYLHIAREGYFPGGTGPWTDDWDNREAFFPGYPLLLRAVHAFVPHWTAAGLLISFVAGAVAVLALARIARAYLPEDAVGRRTVAFFLLSPCAVFLAAGYTEALFLAFALPAWLAAMRHRWALAAVLTAAATTVRVSGMFLAAAIAVLFLLSAVEWRGRWQRWALPAGAAPEGPAGPGGRANVPGAGQGAGAPARPAWAERSDGPDAAKSPGVPAGADRPESTDGRARPDGTARADRWADRGPRRWWSAGWLLLPALPPAAYSWFLHAHTGDWTAWKHAQERGWYRTFHTPWEAWGNTWRVAFDGSQTTGYALMFQAELAAMLVGLALAVVLLCRRRWPEAVYVILSLWALGTSYWYTSIPRATLLWWPLWVGLAALSLRRPRLRTAYLFLAAPLSTLVALTFLTGRWAG